MTPISQSPPTSAAPLHPQARDVRRYSRLAAAIEAIYIAEVLSA